MKQLFAPATSLMNRLRYPQKFALVGLVMLLPLAVVLSQYLTKIDEDINFADKELAGVQYLNPLVDFFRAYQDYVTYTAANPESDSSAQRTSVQNVITAVDSVNAALGAELNVLNEWQAIKRHWQSLGSLERTLGQAQLYNSQLELADQIVKFVNQVGNNSNLILDPDIDSYYLMDTVVLRLPQAFYFLNQIQATGAHNQSEGNFTEADRSSLTILGGLTVSTIEGNADGLNYSIAFNPDLRDDLYPATTSNSTVVRALNALLGNEPSGQFIVEQSGLALNQLSAFYDQAAGLLAQLLDARISRFESQRLIILGVALTAALLTIYLFVGFYRAVQQIIGSLEQASQRMVRGETSGAVSISSRDELAQVALAFNNIASELVSARDQAVDANRAKSAFLASMSHELRTPLNAIIGYAELVQEEMQDEGMESHEADLVKIRGAAHHLLSLINDVLDFSRIEAGRMELFYENVQLAEVVNEVTMTITPLVDQNNNTLTVQVTPEINWLNTDQTRLRQIMLNLLGNATKFTQHGKIKLEIERDTQSAEPFWLIRVKDNGIGMSQEQMGRLFKEFSQADASTTRKYGGTGLGLAITKRFIELMGGTISVSSELRKGTTFTVRLPLQTPSPPTAATTVRKATGKIRKLVRVLVIDDDPDVREMVTRFLEKEGCQVQTAANGADGLKVARAWKPDAITLDILMDTLDGWDTLGALKADAELADTPVYVMSIDPEESKAFALGATDYLPKPINRERLLEMVKRMQPQGDLRVLLVDDDASVREIIGRTLTEQGYDLTTAVNGADALRSVEQTSPSVILLDLMMPRMDGFSFLDQLREMNGGSDIPVIVITAKDLTPQERARLNGSVTGILTKNHHTGDELLAELGKSMRAQRQSASRRTELEPA
jgi:signal transduction histidine kinase/CheY-like chemotaxis protein